MQHILECFINSGSDAGCLVTPKGPVTHWQGPIMLQASTVTNGLRFINFKR